MSTKASGPATPASEHKKHKSKSDKKRRLEEPLDGSVPSKHKRQKHGNDENHDDDAVRKSKKQEKKKKEKHKSSRHGDSLRKSKSPEAEPMLDAQTNGNAHNEIDAGEVSDTSQVTEGPDATEEKGKLKKKEKKQKKQKKTATEPGTDGIENGNEHESEYDHMDIDQPSAAVDELIESTETLAEPDTATGFPFTLEDKSLGVDLLNSPDPSSFYSTRISLYLPIPAITLPNHALSSLLSRHLAPLLLTYFPPVKGIVLAFQDPVMSAHSGSGLNHPLKPPTEEEADSPNELAHIRHVLAQASDQQGVAWVWLTVTFLVFNPQRGDQLYGVNNVASEGFVGLVSYNYFQISVGAKRIPSEWKWRGPETSQDRKQRRRSKGKMDEDGRWSQSSPVPAEPSQSSVADERSRAELEADTGFYLENGDKVDGVMKFRVVDTDMVAGSHRGEWALHVDGTLLDDDAEKVVHEEEVQAWELQHLRQGTPGIEASGGLA